MNKTEESLEVIFEMEEAGYSSEKEGCGYEINSDIDDVIDGDSVPATEPLKSYEEFSSLVRSNSITFERFETLVKSVSYDFFANNSTQNAEQATQITETLTSQEDTLDSLIKKQRKGKGRVVRPDAEIETEIKEKPRRGRPKKIINNDIDKNVSKTIERNK